MPLLELSRSSAYSEFPQESEASSSQAAAAAEPYTGDDYEGTGSGYGSYISAPGDRQSLGASGEAQSGSEGSPTPQPGTAADAEYMPDMVEGDAGELDPREHSNSDPMFRWKSNKRDIGYRIEHSTRFQPGEVRLAAL